jgi:23S rRNA (uridine2552-2'-O)-methyltransferase
MKGGGSGKGGQRGTAGSSSSSKAWLNEHVNDHWVKEAQRQGWRSRAAFKLLQLQEKDGLIRPGNLVIDLGSAPGSWTQVAAKLAGKDGVVVASDILEMKPVPGVNFVCGDFTDDAVRGKIALALESRRADVLLSDMAPNMSGNKLIDQGRHYNLVELAFTMADDWLRTGGSAAFKVFRGEGFDECRTAMSLLFREVHIRKPAASRGRSDEIFLVGCVAYDCMRWVESCDAPAPARHSRPLFT